MGDLEEEPSSSSVLVDLEVDDLVVKTKKLNKKSSFEIASPVGTAGIRGTQFGMGFSPSEGMSLDDRSPLYLSWPVAPSHGTGGKRFDRFH